MQRICNIESFRCNQLNKITNDLEEGTLACTPIKKSKKCMRFRSSSKQVLLVPLLHRATCQQNTKCAKETGAKYRSILNNQDNT